jgi:hypothetical protein
VKITHLHTGPDGRSHFADLDVATVDDAGGTWFETLAVRGLVIRDLVSGFSNEFHTAPRRQLVLQLTGIGEITCGDGTSRTFGPGDLLIADDTTGQGHLSREVEGPRRQALVSLDPDLDLSTLAIPA